MSSHLPSTSLTPVAAADECYRCGYDLRGIDNDRACPECGLLAERSRRVSDEFHNSRPAWLRSISQGVWLILLAIVGPIVWLFGMIVVSNLVSQRITYDWNHRRATPYVWDWLNNHIVDVLLLGFDVWGLLFMLGCWRLTKAEGYPPADATDRRRRWALRGVAFLPLLACGVLHLTPMNWTRSSALEVIIGWLPLILLTFASAPLPLLLFAQLRSLANRARSAHLAEHCGIVGVGTSFALIYVGGMVITAQFADRFGSHWLDRSNSWMLIMLLGCVLSLLMILWSFYLLIRFAISFHKAARKLKREWKRDDLAEKPYVDARDE
jgi:hypothetical protein